MQETISLPVKGGDMKGLERLEALVLYLFSLRLGQLSLTPGHVVGSYSNITMGVIMIIFSSNILLTGL